MVTLIGEVALFYTYLGSTPYWIAIGGGVILLLGSTWLTISNITPIATKTGWIFEKAGRIEKKMGIKTANDNMLRGERMK